MPLILTSAPAVEPISLAEAKAYLRIDSPREDLLIAALISTSRLQIEAALDLALINQTWSYVIDTWPADPHIALPLAPVMQLSTVRTYDPDDSPTPQPLTSFQLDAASTPPRLLRKDTFTQATPLRAMNAIEISFIAGYGAAADAVPAPIRQALMLLVAHWYEHRDPGEVDVPAARIPADVSALLAPFRRQRLV